MRLFFGTVGKTASWNQLPILGRKQYSSEEADGMGKHLSLLPVHSPSNILYWQSLTGNQLAKQKQSWQFSHPSITNWNLKKVRSETE